MRNTPSRHRSRWLAAAAVVAGALTPFAGTVASFAATTPDDTTPAATTPMPVSTTPAPSTPAPTNILGAATSANANWAAPAVITEESKFNLTVAGDINGQATGHIALLSGVASCPASPLFPRQVSTGTRVSVAATPAPTTPADTTPGTQAPLGGSFSQTLSLTPRDSGTFHLCGWVVGFPASSESSTVARFDQVVSVANRPSSLSVDAPASARAGDYFTVKIAGATPASGRRILIMADPDKGQDCSTLRKAGSGKRPLQSVVGLPAGDFNKTLRLRFRSKTAGPYLLCTQVVEINDRNPEVAVGRSIAVTEGIKCVASQTALTQRSNDLTTVRKRRDSALVRLNAAKKKVAPARTRASAQRKVSSRRIATARKAVTKAKSKAGKAKARKRLASVRKTETARMYRAAAPLRTANALVRQQERAYRQYRTGASLLMETITRTRKDLKKYCAIV